MGILKKIYERKKRLEARKKQLALDTAKRLARVLGKKFGAKMVILYGSLAKGKYFDFASDIDIAVSGIGDKFFHAYGYCKNLSEFDIEIRDYDEMPLEFKEKIDKEWKVLYERREKRERGNKNIN